MKKLLLLYWPLLAAVAPAYAQSADSTDSHLFRLMGMLSNVRNFTSSTYMSLTFEPREGVKGTPYLFEKWEGCWLDTIANRPVKNAARFMGNVDLQKHNLFLRLNDGKAFVMDMKDVQAFHFQIDSLTYRFRKVSLNGRDKFVQVLADGNYTLLKDTEVSFRKADYVNNGIVEKGNKYDSYVKTPVYYIWSQGQARKVGLRKKDFLKALPGQQAQAANTFLSERNFDEATAIQLTQHLNSLP